MAQEYPRAIAIRAITRVLSDGKPLDQALEDEILRAGALEPGARAWLQEICSGTMRWRGRLDFAIDQTSLKKRPSGWLRKALLLAAYQLVVQDRTHPGMVVSEWVDEVKKKEGEAPARFANAVLRKIADHATSWRELPFPEKGDFARKAAWASVPEWLWRKFSFERGEEWAKAYALACLERPVLWIRSVDPAFTPESAEPGEIAGAWKVTDSGSVIGRPGFAEGKFYVQDISSQLLVERVSRFAREALGLSGKAGEPRPRALDLCAAPGGKALGLWQAGFAVSATDIDAARLALLRSSIERVHAPVEVIEREAARELRDLDLVWVDAPCTGTGIIRRHPDVRWLRRETDVDSLKRLQGELLKEAWQKLRPGGVLAYSVCSVLKPEAENSLKAAALGTEPAQTWLLSPQDPPHGDGFWACVLKK